MKSELKTRFAAALGDSEHSWGPASLACTVSWDHRAAPWEGQNISCQLVSGARATLSENCEPQPDLLQMGLKPTLPPGPGISQATRCPDPGPQDSLPDVETLQCPVRGSGDAGLHSNSTWWQSPCLGPCSAQTYRESPPSRSLGPNVSGTVKGGSLQIRAGGNKFS